jgi:hypothetical protein
MMMYVSVGRLTSAGGSENKKVLHWGLEMNRMIFPTRSQIDATTFINRYADASFIFDEQEVSFLSRN